MIDLFSSFKAYPGLVAAISTHDEGSMRVADYPAVPEIYLENRARALASRGILPGETAALRLAHTPFVHVATREDAGKVLLDMDGLATKDRGLFLSITVADCLPLFLFDPSTGIIGLLHAGWRGLEGGIVPAGMKALAGLGADPRTMLAGVGPGIGSCHFEAGKKLADFFKAYGATVHRDGKLFLDLKKIARAQLVREGIADAAIEISSECSACLPEKYFSFRRDKPLLVDPMMAVLGLRA